MSTSALRTAIAATTLGALLAAPIGASAAATPHTYTLSSRIIEQAPGAGEWDGTLDLRVSDDGIVNGYYRPFDGPFVPVTGGVDSSGRFWLQIGRMDRGASNYSGTFKNGVIDAFVYNDGHTFELTALPKPTTPQ